MVGIIDMDNKEEFKVGGSSSHDSYAEEKLSFRSLSNESEGKSSPGRRHHHHHHHQHDGSGLLALDLKPLPDPPSEDMLHHADSFIVLERSSRQSSLRGGLPSPLHHPSPLVSPTKRSPATKPSTPSPTLADVNFDDSTERFLAFSPTDHHLVSPTIIMRKQIRAKFLRETSDSKLLNGPPNPPCN